MKVVLSSINALDKISVFSLLCSQRKKHSKLLLRLISLFVCFATASPDLVFSENLPQDKMTVEGRIRLPSGELIPEEGLNVVLLKLVLNAEGQVTPVGPQGRVKTDSKGNFEF